MAAITPTQLDLLRELRRHGADSLMAVSLALRRDYKRVHEDVSIPEAAGLVVRVGCHLRAPWDAVSAKVTRRDCPY